LNESFPRIDARLARLRFNRAGKSFEAAARLETEVGARLLERLDYVKIAPRRILDAGSGPAREARALRGRYRQARVVALDFALPMLPRGRWFSRTPLSVCADLLNIPLAAASVDLVWSNLAVHWVNDPLAAFREFERVLAPGGLLLFSTLGPDTLQELRVAAGRARVHEFVDMHDLGDMLLAAGLAAPVMDMERLGIEYASGGALLEDLRASGQTNAREDRARGLAGHRLPDEFRTRPLRATYEVVYGHAWKAAPAAGRDEGANAAKTIRVFKRIP
jgi:malonyl-CoA O-methyltransferase